MELKSRLPSALLNEQQADEVNTESESGEIQWETEISFEDAYKALEEKLYGFKKVRPVLVLLWKESKESSFKLLPIHSSNPWLACFTTAAILLPYRPLETSYHFASQKSTLQVM